MLKLNQIFKNADVKGEVGIEVEQEFSKHIDPLHNDTWTTHQDGSLRNAGYEFVTRNPVYRGDVHAVLKSLSDFLKPLDKFNDHESPRTSIHIHINTLDLTPMQVWNQIVAYWLLDSCLVELCGIYRVTNLFCLRLRDATGLLDIARDELSAKTPLYRAFNQERIRYASQNLNALSKFNSLEYRAKGGKFDVDSTKNWIEALLAIKDKAKEFANPTELLSYYFQVGPKQFAKDFLTYHYYNLVVFNVPKYKDKMDYNANMLIDLVGRTDWDGVIGSKIAATIKNIATYEAEVARIMPNPGPRPLRQRRPVPMPRMDGWNPPDAQVAQPAPAQNEEF